MEEGERKVETPMLARMSYRAGYACQRVRVIDFGQLQRVPGWPVGRKGVAAISFLFCYNSACWLGSMETIRVPVLLN